MCSRKQVIPESTADGKRMWNYEKAEPRNTVDEKHMGGNEQGEPRSSVDGKHLCRREQAISKSAADGKHMSRDEQAIPKSTVDGKHMCRMDCNRRNRRDRRIRSNSQQIVAIRSKPRNRLHHISNLTPSPYRGFSVITDIHLFIKGSSSLTYHTGVYYI